MSQASLAEWVDVRLTTAFFGVLVLFRFWHFSFMKKLRRTNLVLLRNSRWVAYTSAGAATALAGIASAEAAIHYSGMVDRRFDASAGFSYLPL